MNWDAPDFPKDKQINENVVLLILAGPECEMGREPLAWEGYPATGKASDFQVEKGQPPRTAQAWKVALNAAIHNAGKQNVEIDYLIHDAGAVSPESSDRIGPMAQALTTESPEFDFFRQAFNTSSLLGEMGAGTALTNVALAIAYANHLGKKVLVAGTTDLQNPTAVMVLPPAQAHRIDETLDWFQADPNKQQEQFLPWWGLRHDAPALLQGYSE